MNNETPLKLKRDCQAVVIPSGEKITLPSETTVWITQSLGGSYTLMTERGQMVGIDGEDADALGLSRPAIKQAQSAGTPVNTDDIQDQIWSQLRTCYDPEIPVNIVDLGLIYGCGVTSLAGGGYKASVRFTLTAQGCGMGQFLKKDIESKLRAIPGVNETNVELVWDPPWNQSMISGAAKQQLGIE
jgi:probable FeS assembly SUF system protein SufT